MRHKCLSPFACDYSEGCTDGSCSRAKCQYYKNWRRLRNCSLDSNVLRHTRSIYRAAIMLFTSTLALVGFGAYVNARFQPRGLDEEIVHLHDLVPRDIATPSTTQDASGKVPYFDYEKLTVSPTLLNGLLQTKLGQAALGKYLNVFKFADQVVTSSTTAAVNYTLKGPGNCKVFPGDAAWPTTENWSALKVLSGNALLKPLPQAHICYANTGGSPDSAACQAMGASWTDPYFQ